MRRRLEAKASRVMLDPLKGKRDTTEKPRQTAGSGRTNAISALVITLWASFLYCTGQGRQGVAKEGPCIVHLGPFHQIAALFANPAG